MNSNPLSNPQADIHSNAPRINRRGKFTSSFTKVAALLVALNYFPAAAEAGTLPRPSQVDEAQKANGYLKVYSSTQDDSPSGGSNGDYFYPHTSYWIYDKLGTRIRTVENHGLYPDEGPETIELAPGKYTIQAWSDDKGLALVPVIIKRNLTTSLHLEN